MKPHGSDCEFKQQRNDDLMRAYHELIKSTRYIRMPEIYRKVVNMPSSRFWVSEERAAIVVAAMMRGEMPKKMRPLKREMFDEIYRRVLKLREKNPQLTILQLVSQVVEQPAPKFYFTPGTAKVYITKAKKEWYFRRTKRRLRHCF